MKKLLLLALLVAPAAFAQQYSIGWYKIAGGGGTSTNGPYTITGTIGQHDASPTMTGGNYSLTGGFWSLIAVQTPGAPTLTISASGNQVMLTWPTASTGFTLQTNNVLNPATWGAYTGTVNNNSTTFSPPRTNVFFRLYHP